MKALNRFTFVFVSLLFISTFANAQLYKVDLDEKVQKASLIIEGKVVSKKVSGMRIIL